MTLCNSPSVHFKKPGKAEVAFCSVCRVYKGRGVNSCFYESHTHKTKYGHLSLHIIIMIHTPFSVKSQTSSYLCALLHSFFLPSIYPLTSRSFILLLSLSSTLLSFPRSEFCLVNFSTRAYHRMRGKKGKNRVVGLEQKHKVTY